MIYPGDKASRARVEAPRGLPRRSGR